MRFDSRDTGRSTHYPAGAPPYGLRDLADDAVGLLDALGIPVAHLVGRSMGGGTAIIAALDHPDRVATLTLVGTTNGDPDLPAMSPEMAAAFERPPSGDPVADIVATIRAYAGPSPHFDEAATRETAAAARPARHRPRSRPSTSDLCGGPHDDTLASLSSLTMSSTRSRASPNSIWLFSR